MQLGSQRIRYPKVNTQRCYNLIFLGPRYTEEEDEIVINAIKNPGATLEDVAALLPGRTLASVRKRIAKWRKSPNSPVFQKPVATGKRILNIYYYIIDFL